MFKVYCRLRPLPACVPVIEECIKVIDTKTLKLTSTKVLLLPICR